MSKEVESDERQGYLIGSRFFRMVRAELIFFIYAGRSHEKMFPQRFN